MVDEKSFAIVAVRAAGFCRLNQVAVAVQGREETLKHLENGTEEGDRAIGTGFFF